MLYIIHTNMKISIGKVIVINYKTNSELQMKIMLLQPEVGYW
jgi:hypothetical protein